MQQYEVLYEELIEISKRKKLRNLSLITKAYNTALSLHTGQYRKSGEPYIIHPISVAIILANLNFNERVLASALLHDTVEDCGYTIQDVENNFGEEVSQIVNAVTAVKLEDLSADLQEQLKNDDFTKFNLNSKTFQKLLGIGQLNVYSFFIKFADRLHNLQTIDCFNKYKQLEKVRETRTWVLPFAKILGARYFYEQINNICFKITEDETKETQIICDKYFQSQFPFLNEIKEQITTLTNDYLSKNRNNIKLAKVKISPKTEQAIYYDAKKIFGLSSCKELRQSQILRVPTYRIQLVFDTKLKAREIFNSLFELFNEFSKKKILDIIGFVQNKEFGGALLVVQDYSRNRYELDVCNNYEYYVHKVGKLQAEKIQEISTEDETIQTDFINVKTRSGEIIAMPNGSTVLDFAFKLHNDLGFACRGAYLNDAPQLSPIYTKLTEGDKINIEIEKDNFGNCKNIAEIRWLLYAQSEYAKRVLVKYFEHNNI